MSDGKVTIRGIPDSLWRRVKAHCAAQGITICEFVVEALTARLKETPDGNHTNRS